MMATTIREKIIIIFTSFLLCVCLLVVVDWWNMINIEQKLYVSEHFEDLFNSILEARRYEKNVFLYHDKESLNENIISMNKAMDIADNLRDDIIKVVGEKEYADFHEMLVSYNDSMKSYAEKNKVSDDLNKNMEKVRSEGKTISDFAGKLLELKRKRIHLALSRTLSIPFSFLAVFSILSLVVGRIVSKKILKPLKLIRQTIKQVASGDFKTIPYQQNGNDEISRLIDAFNKMADELDTRQEQLVQSRKIAAIGTFTAGIAHELNNPINNIYLTAETLFEDYSDIDETEGKELISDILSQAERAGEIIRNLLDFSKREQPAFEDLKIDAIIDKSLKLIKNQTMLGRIKLDVNVQVPVPVIQGNFRNLEQVFLNLFINSIHAMPGGGTISVNVTPEPNGYVKIDIKDTGAGIKPEHLEHIFEPFYTTKGVEQSTGLGLSVSYSLVKKHGGYIEVQSEVNAGTTFSIYLPIKKDQTKYS